MRDIPQTAKQMFLKIREIQQSCSAAKAALSSDLGELVTLPGRILSISTLMGQLNAETPPITPDLLGPVAVSQFHHAPEKTWDNHYAGEYAAFKIAVMDLAGYLLTLEISHTFSPTTGVRVYNVIFGSEALADVDALLDAVVACDFT